MSHRQMIENKMAKKSSEIQMLEEKIKVARIYVQALQDVLKALDKSLETDEVTETVLRKGSIVDTARETILANDRPMHIDELILAVGREATRENKASFGGSLAAYVRRNEIFTRPAPNTYGLVELGHFDDVAPISPEPPVGFGRASSEDMDDEIPF